MIKSENFYLLESELNLEDANLILLENTSIQEKSYMKTTSKLFIGKFDNNSFSIIGTFSPIGVACVFNGKFIQKDKLEIQLTTTLHKAFRILFKIWLFVIAGVILFFTIFNFSFINYENTDSPEKKVAFVVTHGAGHNANYNHDYGIMADGNKMKWDRQTVDQMTAPGVLNNDYVDAIKERFGNSYSIPTYQNNKNKYNNFVEKHGEEKGEKLYESYQKSGTN